ncbi:MAG TPA: YciI family protein [Blastocatellia bacterium]|nr:YciI family protein [Blastocatellia bacterium]
MSETFLIIYRSGPAWIEGKPISEQPIQSHGKYMLELYKSGVMRFAGPFSDDTGGAAVIEVESLDQAISIADQDPAIKDRIFTYELRPWRLIPWEQYVSAGH